MIEIDRNIPIPPVKGRERMYPFLEMEIGDSFLHPGSIMAARSLTCQKNKCMPPKYFVCRSTAEGPRIWRVDDKSE